MCCPVYTHIYTDKYRADAPYVPYVVPFLYRAYMNLICLIWFKKTIYSLLKYSETFCL